MISARYIHEYDEYDELEKYIQESNNEMDSLMREYNYICQESSLFDLFTEGKNESNKVEEKKTNILNKLAQKAGEQIIHVIDKLKAIVMRVHEFFQAKIWARKNDLQKMEALLKKNPNMSKKIQLAITNGDLDIKDYKTMKDLMDGTSDILDKINKGKLDKSGAEKAFEKLETRWEKYGKPLVAVAAGVTASVGAYIAITKIIPESIKNRINSQEMIAQANELQAKVRMDKRQERRDAGLPEEVGLTRFKNSLITKCCNRISANTRKQETFFGKVAKWMDTSLKSLISNDENDKKIIEKSMKTVDRIDDVMNRKKREESDRQATYASNLKDKQKETPDEAADKAAKVKTAQLQAEENFKSNPARKQAELDDVKKKAEAQAEGQSKGKAKWYAANQDTADAQTRSTSQAQAEGQSKGKAEWYGANQDIANAQTRSTSQAQQEGRQQARQRTTSQGQSGGNGGRRGGGQKRGGKNKNGGGYYGNNNKRRKN